MASTDRVGVVILTYNAAATIGACLGSLRAELRPGDFALVADNGSTDGTIARVRAEQPWVECQEHGANLGFAAGNNRAIARALARGCEFVLVLNPDTVVEPGALAALRAAAAAAPAAAALQPLLVDAEGARIDSAGLSPRRGFGGSDDGHGEAAATVGAAPRPIFGCCGAAAFLRAAAVQDAAVRQQLGDGGPFDAELFLLAEDLELAFRLQLAGYQALLVPAARVRHRRGISGRQPDRAAARRRKHWLQRNTVAVALRHWPWSALLLRSPLLVWRIAQALWCGRGAATRCLPLWRRYLRGRAAARRGAHRPGVDGWLR